jgi:transposase
MVPGPCLPTEPVPPPAYHRLLAKQGSVIRIDALTLVRALHLLALCRRAVRLAQERTPVLSGARRGHPVVYAPESLLVIGLLRVLWRLSYRDIHDWLVAWPALAVACGLPTDQGGRPRVPSPAQQCKRQRALGAPAYEMLFVCAVRAAITQGIMGLRDLIIDSAPVLAWRTDDPDAAYGHAPAHHAAALLRGFRVHTVLCRGSGLPAFFRVAPANGHDAPFAQPLLAAVVALYDRRPRVVRLDAAYWGLALITWIHTTLGATAVIPWNPKRARERTCLPPTWTRQDLGKRGSIERFFGRIFLFFHLQRPRVVGWSAVTQQVALTYTAAIVVALAAHAQGRDDLIRSPKRVLAHSWEGLL